MIERLKRTEDPALRDLLLRTRGSIQFALRGHVVRRGTVARYLAATQEPKLHFGAGPHRLEGWLNTDLIAGDAYLDLRRRLPFADGSFAFAFGEHVIEHVDERSGQRLLGELRRVLRPGGVLRVTTPDLRKIVALYEDRNPVIGLDAYIRHLDAITGKRHQRPCQVFNDYLRLWGHRYVYDEEDLTSKLLEAGFSRVERHAPGESSFGALRGLERHGEEPWVNDAEAMCLEAAVSR